MPTAAPRRPTPRRGVGPGFGGTYQPEVACGGGYDYGHGGGYYEEGGRGLAKGFKKGGKKIGKGFKKFGKW